VGVPLYRRYETPVSRTSMENLADIPAAHPKRSIQLILFISLFRFQLELLLLLKKYKVMVKWIYPLCLKCII